MDDYVCFCDCVVAIHSTRVVYKVWDYSCLLFCIMSFCLSPHGPHTVRGECDERQWMIDAHGASTHLLCSSGGALRDAQPLWEVLGVWEAAVGTRHGNSANSQTQLSPALHHPLAFSLQPHQTFLRRGLFTGKGSRWAPLGFWMPWNLVS